MTDAIVTPRASSPLSGPGASRRQLLVGATLLAAAGAAYAFTPRTVIRTLGTSKLDALVPHAFGGWRFQASSGLVLPPADQLRDRIYSQLLTRVYSHSDGSSMMLLIAYSGSQDGTIQVHRPEVCYPASGFHLSTVEDRSVQLAPKVDVPSRYIVAETELRTEQMIYWTRLGHLFPRKWSEQKLAVVEENLRGLIPDGVLVRISTLGQADARPSLDAFAKALFGAVGPQMKSVLIGPA
ncbi:MULTISPECIES: exosortase-associated protein EpsI, V-type [unclassified Sphingomonas]|uniref:exosortase-associated protein EpsI, V-type n=1 Tax=unclassified Sphingomonas TaxID=196159 RepID=UPI001F5AAFEA|nr:MULTISPECIES: exosortase-associated protein EpsI, V-type [unclassified Sphingomonas]